MVLRLKQEDKKVIDSPQELVGILQRLLRLEDKIDQDKEHFYCIHLDTRSRVKVIEVVSIGIVNASLVHPREVFRRAIVEGATKILVAHNHPSNDAEPSDADVEITKTLRQAGGIIGIQLVDPLIFTPNDYRSLRESACL